jgi:hypothetical protein
MSGFGGRVVRTACVAVLVLAVDASNAFAQAQVRVLRDGTTIWRRDVRMVATQVKRGEVLEVTGREGDWYVVTIPPGHGRTGELGLIAVSQVEVISGTPPPRRPGSPGGGAVAEEAPPIEHRPVEVFGFGEVGYGAWLAHHSFSAVFGDFGSFMFGGGGEVRINGNVFVNATIERFQRTGQRVFVDSGQVSSLGIADTVRVIPLSVSGGYRLEGPKYTYYFGGGIGRYWYRETSDFANASENVDQQFTSYQALGGVEFGTGYRPIRAAVEVQFTTVPNALGSNGAAQAFGEHNLGGVQVRVKILAGQ